jgi:prepilin-type N-terminal cleavage/methylation domain-containing protein
MAELNNRRSLGHGRRRRGFTLAEVTVASLLVGVVMAGALAAAGAAVRSRRAAAAEQTAAHLGEMLLAEITALPYIDPEDPSSSRGPEGGEEGNRKKFDDADDYENYTESDICDAENKKLDGYDGWTRSVRVRWADRLTGENSTLSDTGLKRIEVTVTAPDGSETKRYALRSRDGAGEQFPAIETTVIHTVCIKLELEDPDYETHASANLINHVNAADSGNE